MVQIVWPICLAVSKHSYVYHDGRPTTRARNTTQGNETVAAGLSTFVRTIRVAPNCEITVNAHERKHIRCCIVGVWSPLRTGTRSRSNTACQTPYGAFDVVS